MLRTWRPWGSRTLGLLTLVTLAATHAAHAADDWLQTQSTLAPRIEPQVFSIDATIASMVRRGLLADIKPISERPTAPLPAKLEIPPPAPKSQDGWHPHGAASSQSSAPSGEPSRWRPPAPSAAMAPRAPAALDFFSGEVAADDAPDQAVGDPAEMPAPTLIAQVPAETANETTGREPTPVLVDPFAAEPLASESELAASDAFAEPRTSEDPPPEEHLAPVDQLPETPAPAADAPGDPREPEIGDQQLEGTLLPPANARPQIDAAPPSSSLSGQSLTPVGEPDRIEEADESIAPPSNTEAYQEADDAPPPAPRQPLTRNQIALREKVRRVLKYYYANPLNTGDRSPWEVMHCMLSYEVHSRILKGGPQGEPITTVGWLCFNQPCKGRTLMYLNENGDLRVKVGPALQGHQGQLLALLAQARVRTDYPLKVQDKDFTVADLIEVEKATCYPRTELTFKLIGLQRYLDINAKWMNDQGMQWDFPTLLREEMRQPVRTAACGGTHRLAGLILTVKKRQRSGLPVDGEYAAAQKFVDNYANYAYRLQNGDGSFSTEWFKGPGAEEDVDRRLKTTGHQLEFLIYASNEEQLDNYRLVKAVNYLSNIMWANRGRDWEAGPLGHAIHSLVLYDRLVFAPHDGQAAAPAPVARQQSPARSAMRSR